MRLVYRAHEESLREQCRELFCDQRQGWFGCEHEGAHTYNLPGVLFTFVIYGVGLGIFFWPAVLGAWLSQVWVERCRKTTETTHENKRGRRIAGIPYAD